MKKLALTIMLGALLVTSTACSGVANKMEKTGRALTASDYVLVMYSGGEVTRWYYVADKIVNAEESTDGYFFIENDRLVRISGDVIIEEVKGKSIERITKEMHLPADKQAQL
jgi:hypothetical protein